MVKTKEGTKIINPINQLNLFGYDNYFNSLVKLFKKKRLPKSLLFSGAKGSGKATFCYHFINYILSSNEDNKYNINEFSINETNQSYKHLNSNTHPNFFLVENKPLDKETKIDQIKNLIKFLNHSTYSNNLKIIMIDNVENLNLNSSNALLKSIEEPEENTFFFIVHNNAFKILDTIKSRCTKFKIFFTSDQKKTILNNLVKKNSLPINVQNYNDDLYFDTPGNIIKFISLLHDEKSKNKNDILSNILFLMDKYKSEKNSEILLFISLYIEKFYSELCSKNIENSPSYFLHYSNILNQINNMKKFNLDEKNVFIFIKDLLINEKK